MLRLNQLIGFGSGNSSGPQVIAPSSNDWDYTFDGGGEWPFAGNALGDHTQGGYVDNIGGDSAISCLITLNGAFDIEWTATALNNSCFGVHAIDEDATRTTGYACGMQSMTNSFFWREAAASPTLYIGASSEGVLAITDGSVLKLSRDESGTITLTDDDALVHTFTSTYTGVMRFAMGSDGTPFDLDFDNIKITDYSKIQRDGFLNEASGGSINWGDAVASSKNIGQRFTATRSGKLTAVKINLTGVTVSFNAHVELWSDDGTNPSSQIGSDSDTVSMGSTGDKTFTPASDNVVEKGKKYWIVLPDEGTTGNVAVKYITGNYSGMGAGNNDTITSISDSLSNEIAMEIAIDTSAGEPTPDHETLVLINDTELANASTTFPDNSQFARTISVVGDAQWSTAQAKFGSSSMLFDGGSDELTIPGSEDFVVTSADFFSIDFFFRLASTTVPHQFCGGNLWTAVNADSWLCDVQYNAGSPYIRWANYTNECKYASFTMDTNWHHFAILFLQGTQYLLIDGVQRATSSHTSTWGSASNTFRIGNSAVASGAQELNGNLQQFRITKRIPFDPTGFTVPTAAYP